jgi:hypothetical protein
VHAQALDDFRANRRRVPACERGGYGLGLSRAEFGQAEYVSGDARDPFWPGPLTGPPAFVRARTGLLMQPRSRHRP